MDSSVARKVVVITGAGSGIGRAIALAFAGRGAILHLTDVRPDRTAAVAEEVVTAGGLARTHRVDSRDAAAMEALAVAVYETDGRVDILCNNAGVGHSGLAQDMPLALWREVIEINLMGTVNGITVFLPRLLKQSGLSHIVNTASMAGLIGIPGLAAYSASKFGVVGLTEALATELPPDKVHVVAICPGIIKTNIVKDSQLLVMGAVDQQSALGYYDRHGFDPSVVAADVLRAVDSGELLRLSGAGPYAWLWRLKRISVSLYRRAGRLMARHMLERGLPHS